MNKCPHCAEETISNLEKLCLGPATTIRCSNCNNRISVPWWPSVIMLLSVIGVYVIHTKLTLIYSFSILMLLGIGYLYIHVKFIPLITRKENGYY